MPIDHAALVDRFLAGDAMAAAAGRAAVRVVQAPGRVNLIGEHTDYNDGFVLPAAIDLGLAIALVPTDDQRVTLTLDGNGDHAEIDLAAIGRARGHWSDYVAGTAWALREAGVEPRGFRGRIAADLPAGAGLSSSAALELASAWALVGGTPPPLEPMALARVAQRAENEFVGVACGLMDQFAVTFGRAGHALLLDCRSLEHRPVPIPAGLSLVICHSGAPRELAGSAYNDRRAECDRAVAAIQTLDPSVRSLRDVSPTTLAAAADRLDAVAYRRARHVVTENERVVETVEALAAGRLGQVGALMAASHASLRDDYEVSSAPLDALVGIAAHVPGVIGARLTGAGFGGCTVNLVRDEAVDALEAAVVERYEARTGLTARVFRVRAADGVQRIA